MIKEYWTKMGFTPTKVFHLIRMEEETSYLYGKSYYLSKSPQLNSGAIDSSYIRQDIQNWINLKNR